LASDGSRCVHCALPVAHGADFCCVGCRLAAAAGGAGDASGWLNARLLLAAFLTAGVMEFDCLLYSDAIFGPAATPDALALKGLARFAVAALTVPVMLLLGVPLAKGAWADLRRGRVRLDGLILLATGAAFALSLRHTLSGTGEVYFETATMTLLLVTFGRRLEAHARTKGKDAASALAECLPRRAHRDGNGVLADVDPEALAPGDLVRVLPGEAAPADLVVVGGAGEIRAAHLTGEETPRAVSTDDEIPAGALNGTTVLVGRVVRRASDGMLGRVRELLDAPLPLTRQIRIADRLAAWLVAVAVVLAIAGGTRSYLLEGADAAVRTALSVLLVACPCALGIATPLAYRAMRAALARRGVLVRDPVALEVAGTVDVVLFDKTGTLTDPRAARLHRVRGSAERFERLRALVAQSGHALAASAEPSQAAVADVRVHAGAGVEGRFGAVLSRAGSPEWMDRSGSAWDDDTSAQRASLASQGATLVAYEEDGFVRALAAVRPALRPGAAEAVADLRRSGIAVEILSGDHQIAAERIGAAVGATAHGNLSPEDKVRRLEELRRSGRRTLMAGDGINDSPALRAADVGVAVACGTAAARSQAQVEILGDDLRAVPRLVSASRKLRRTVRGNLAWSVAYNAVALAMAASGHLPPLVAVAAMVASSLAVSVRSYRLLAWKSVA
jgi:heavy metal translocating P-type ATPase